MYVEYVGGKVDFFSKKYMVNLCAKAKSHNDYSLIFRVISTGE